MTFHPPAVISRAGLVLKRNSDNFPRHHEPTDLCKQAALSYFEAIYDTLLRA